MLIESLTRDERLKERRDSEGGGEWKNVERETLERSREITWKKVCTILVESGKQDVKGIIRVKC